MQTVVELPDGKVDSFNDDHEKVHRIEVRTCGALLIVAVVLNPDVEPRVVKAYGAGRWVFAERRR